MKCISLTATFLFIVLTSLQAHGESSESVWAPLERDWSIRLLFGRYQPDIDSQFTTGATNGTLPYEDFFGNQSPFMTTLGIERHLYNGIGSFSLGLTAGTWSVEGKLQSTSGGSETPDTTELSLYPLGFEASYYIDNLVSLVPLVPFVRAGYDYVIWEILDGSGNTATFKYSSEAGTAEYEAFGATQGWHYTIGLQLLLDKLDPRTADDFERDAGVRNSYLGLEYRDAQFDDFGSRDSIRLGGKSVNIGLYIDL